MPEGLLGIIRVTGVLSEIPDHSPINTHVRWRLLFRMGIQLFILHVLGLIFLMIVGSGTLSFDERISRQPPL